MNPQDLDTEGCSWIAKRTKTRCQKHSEEEHQETGSDTKNTQEEKRTIKFKKRSKEKSQALILATKLKNKYSALDECAEKQKKKGGYSYGSTSEKLRLMREGSVDDLPTLVRDISTMVPVSNIDKTQARHQGGQNFFESTRLDDENAVEACLREETRLVEEVERIRDRENSECDLRETMRKRTGPSDLRQTNLNRDTDAPHRPELLE